MQILCHYYLDRILGNFNNKFDLDYFSRNELKHQPSGVKFNALIEKINTPIICFLKNLYQLVQIL